MFSAMFLFKVLLQLLHLLDTFLILKNIYFPFLLFNYTTTFLKLVCGKWGSTCDFSI